MRSALENSSIDELNDLSTVLEVSDLLAIYSDKMKELYNKCSVLKKSYTNKPKVQKPNTNPWFDNECHIKRREYSRARRKVRVGTLSQDELVRASKEYKQTIGRSKAQMSKKRQEI